MKVQAPSSLPSVDTPVSAAYAAMQWQCLEPGVYLHATNDPVPTEVQVVGVGESDWADQYLVLLT